MVSLAYLYGLIALCRASLLFEACISIGLPLFCWATGWFRYNHPRLTQLLLIESLFNLLAVTGRVSVQYGVDWLNGVSSSGFLLFFVLQVGGFALFQIKLRKPLGMVQSLCGALIIGMWWFGIEDSTNRMDADSRFLMWGEDAPLAVQLYYVAWFLNISLSEALPLPWLRVFVVHSVSVGLSMWSGEFFHVRLFTACHIFVIDMVTGVGMQRPEGLGRDFAVVPARWLPGFHRWFQPAWTWAMSGACVLLLVLSLLWGLDLRP